jgi:hypothetical protein
MREREREREVKVSIKRILYAEAICCQFWVGIENNERLNRKFILKIKCKFFLTPFSHTGAVDMKINHFVSTENCFYL